MQGTDTGMNEKYLRILRDGFVAMDMAQNILVVKTVAGRRWQWQRHLMP